MKTIYEYHESYENEEIEGDFIVRKVLELTRQQLAGVIEDMISLVDEKWIGSIRFGFSDNCIVMTYEREETEEDKKEVILPWHRKNMGA